MNKFFTFFKKKINFLFLIFYNGFISLRKFKLPLTVFLVLTTLLSTTISTFSEINWQIRSEVEKSKINSDSNDYQYIYSVDDDYYPENVYDIFCSDYHEINAPAAGGEKLTIRRQPRLSFGEHGCFQALNEGDIQIVDYVVNPITQQILKIRDSNPVEEDREDFIYKAEKPLLSGQKGLIINPESIKFNEKNPYFQNSIYGRLNHKYLQTKDFKYKKTLDNLYSLFITNLIIFIEDMLISRLNQFLRENKVYEKTLLQNSFLSQFASDNYGIYKNPPRDLRSLKSLEKFIQTPNSQLLQTNYKIIYQYWNNFYHKLINWENAELISLNGVQNENVQIFNMHIENLIAEAQSADLTNDLNQKFLDLINSEEWEVPVIWFWIKSQIEKLQKEIATTDNLPQFWNQISQKNKLIFINTNYLKNKIETFFVTPLLKFYELVDIWEKTFLNWTQSREEWLLRKGKKFASDSLIFANEKIMLDSVTWVTAETILQKLSSNNWEELFFTTNLFNKIEMRINLLRNQIKLWNLDSEHKRKTFQSLISAFQNIFTDYAFSTLNWDDFSKSLDPQHLNSQNTDDWINQIQNIIDEMNWFKNRLIEQNERVLGWQIRFQLLYNFPSPEDYQVFLNFANENPFTNGNKFTLEMNQYINDENEISVSWTNPEQTSTQFEIYTFRELWTLWQETEINIDSVESFKFNIELLQISHNSAERLYNELEKNQLLHPEVEPNAPFSWNLMRNWINFFDAKQFYANPIWEKYFEAFRALRTVEIWNVLKSFDNQEIEWTDENNAKQRILFSEFRSNLIEKLKIFFNSWRERIALPDQLKTKAALRILSMQTNYAYFLLARAPLFKKGYLPNDAVYQESEKYNQLLFENNLFQLKERKLFKYFERSQAVLPLDENYKQVLEQEIFWFRVYTYDSKSEDANIDYLKRFNDKWAELKLKGFNSDFYKFFYPVEIVSPWLYNLIKPLTSGNFPVSHELSLSESVMEQIYNYQTNNLFFVPSDFASSFNSEQFRQIRAFLSSPHPFFISSKHQNFLTNWKLDINKILKNIISKLKLFISQQIPGNNKIIIHSSNVGKFQSEILQTAFFQIEIDNFEWTNHPEIAQAIIEKEKQLFITNAQYFQNWKIPKNIHFEKNTKKHKFNTNPWKLEIFHRAVAYLNDFDLRILKNTYFQDKTSGKEGLIIEFNPQFEFKLTAGSAIPKQYREVILSNNYAKSHNIKIGDIVSLLGIKGLFKVVGLGAQSEFIFPGISVFNVIPEGDEYVVYVHPTFYDFVREQIFASLSSIFSVQKNDHFLYFQGDKSKMNQNFQKFKTEIGEEQNAGYTDKSLFFYPKSFSKTNAPQIKPINYKKNNLIFFSAEKFFTPNYLLNRKIINLVTQFFWISSLALFAIVMFVWIISLLNLIVRKIEESKKSLGILRAQGISGWHTNFDFLGLVGPLFIALFLGWILSVFLQIPIFSILEKKFVFNFQKYFFNLFNLLISIGIIFISFFVFVWLFYRFKIHNVRILNLISSYTHQVNSRFFIYFKSFFLRKIIKLRSSNLKMNYLFFLFIWKKIFVLFVVALFFVLNCIGTVFLFSVAEKTINRQYEKFNYEWNFEYIKPVASNPFTRNIAYENRGYKSVLDDQINNFEPLDKRPLEIYFQIGDFADSSNNRYEKHAFKTLLDLEFALVPFHGKSLNFVYMEHIFKSMFNAEGEEVHRQMCETLSNFFSRDLEDECVELVLKGALPFDYDIDFDAQKLRNILTHFPFSLNGAQYNPELDELYTEFLAVRKENGKQISVTGIAPQSRAFVLPDDLKRKLHDSRGEKEGYINVIVNRVFLDNFPDLTVGSEFKLLNKKIDFYHKDFNKPFQASDWSYLEPGTNQVKSFSDFPRDTFFYKGSKIVNLDEKFTIDENRQIWQTQEDGSRLPVKIKNRFPFVKENSPAVYLDSIDIERIQLRLPDGRIVFPFLADIKYGTNYLKNIDPISTWWNYQLKRNNFQYKTSWVPAQKNGKEIIFRIAGSINTYRKVQMLISQTNANQILNYPLNNPEQFQNFPIEHLLRQENYFTGRFSYAEGIEEALYNVSFNQKFGFVDLETIASGNRVFTIKGFQALSLEKKAGKELIKYFLGLMTLTFVISFLGTLLLLIFILSNILDIIKSKSIQLKILGFNAWELFKQSLFLVLPSILLASIAGIGLIYFFLKSSQNYVAINYQFYFFVNDSFIVYLAPILILLAVFFCFSWLQYRGLQKLKLTETVKV